jgi:hypothetical protein
MRAPACLGVFFLWGCAATPARVASQTLDDAPVHACQATARSSHPSTHEEALEAWKRLEDINAWIADRFVYDRARAVELSESRRLTQGDDGARSEVFEPASFYLRPKGVCVDLARFALESARKIEPGAEPRYLLLEFEPIVIEGELLRRHWLVVFQREGQLYAFADSKRPGHISGPFASVELLVQDYERFRERKIVSSKLVDDFKKKTRQRQLKSMIPAQRG